MTFIVTFCKTNPVWHLTIWNSQLIAPFEKKYYPIFCGYSKINLGRKTHTENWHLPTWKYRIMEYRELSNNRIPRNIE